MHYLAGLPLARESAHFGLFFTLKTLHCHKCDAKTITYSKVRVSGQMCVGRNQLNTGLTGDAPTLGSERIIMLGYLLAELTLCLKHTHTRKK